MMNRLFSWSSGRPAETRAETRSPHESDRLVRIDDNSSPIYLYGSQESDDLDGDVPSEEAVPESQPEEPVAEERETRDGVVGTLTRRLRCLFSAITWPIVPLGTVVSVALLWVLYAAFVLELRKTCSHPLHWYAFASLVLVSYAPHHSQVRANLFQYQRDRDGPSRPPRVRMYDQLFHTFCLLYVYGGITLVQTCREDVAGANLEEIVDKEAEELVDVSVNSCQATCPNLFQALSVYVTTLELFTFALILPLLFLPCIYLWFLRRATADVEAIAQLQDRLEEEEALLNSGGITADEILNGLEDVKLVSQRTPGLDGERRIFLLPCSATDISTGKDGRDLKECCVCMNEFHIHEEDDDPELGGSGGPTSENDSAPEHASYTESEKIVRTKCGHIFHKHCLAGWIGGRWQNDSSSDGRRRRARRTCCPLCREDLRPLPAN